MASNKIIAGKLYANWCGHCQTLKPEWEAMKKSIEEKIANGSIKKKVEFKAIEQSAKDAAKELEKINKYIAKITKSKTSKTHGGENSVYSKVELQGGYPTIFKVDPNGKVSYYGGARTAAEMEEWFLSDKVTGGKKIKRTTTKNMKKKNKTAKKTTKKNKTRRILGLFGL